MKILKVLAFILPIIMIGCSDSGDKPTGPGGGSGDPALSVGNTSGAEGATISFTVSLNVAASVDVTFSYATSDGSATSGDYTTTSGTTTITAGNLSKIISVPTIDDGVVDKNETFILTISNVQNAAIADVAGTATIIDNDMSFSLDVRPLIQGNSCLNSSCHGAGFSSGGFSFGALTYSNVRNAVGTNGAIIVVGNASASNFYTKVTTSPPFGSQMPLTGAKLSTADMNKIRDWINQGALNN